MIETAENFQKDIDDIAQIPVVTTMLDVISQTTGMGFIAIARVTEDRWITCSSRDDLGFGLKPGDELQIKTTICDEIRDSGKAVIIDHVEKDPQFCSHHTPAMYGFQSYISVPIIRKDGSFFGTLCAIDPQPHNVSSPTITGMFELFSDLISFHLDAIEHQNRLEKTISDRTNELKENYAELEQMNKELQSFAYISSHDLQEPLRKIQMMTSVIEEYEFENLSDSGKDYFRRIKNAAARMQTLINDLLAFSRTVNSKREFEPTDIASVIEEVMEDFGEELSQSGAQIAISGTYTLEIIPFQFRQLLYNLIGNSIKFSKADEPLSIAIDTRVADITHIGSLELPGKKKYCMISFSDNGIGFDQKYSDKIFQMFQSLHERTQYEGTGLGLAIVKKIVENHHGIINATSEVGQGARFDIYLPA